MADRLHLPQGRRLGLVLSVDHSRRLLPLHHRLEAVHDHAGGRCDGDPQAGPAGIGLRQGRGRPKPRCSAITARPTSPATSPIGSSTRGWLSPRRTEPSADPGQDRALAPDLKNRVLLENYYCRATRSQHWRLRRTLQPPPLPGKPRNLTPADVYFDRHRTIIDRRRKIKDLTIRTRRLAHQAKPLNIPG